MTFKKVLLAAAGLFLAAAAYAQISIPLVATGGISPTASLIQVLPLGQPSAQSVYAYPSQITGTYGYYKSVPTSGFQYAVGTNITRVAFNPSGTLAVGYVTLPTAPNDGMEVCVSSSQIVTALYVCATSTGIGNCVTTGINNALAGSLSANTKLCYLYSKSNTTWDRS